MWLKRLSYYLLEHQWLTLALVFFGTFVPFIGTIGILIAALVTLRKSLWEGAILTLAATLPYLVSFYISQKGGSSISFVIWIGVGVAVLSNILTYIFAVMLVRRVSWSNLLQIAALLGVLVVSVIHLVYPDVANWWGHQLQSYYIQAQTATDGLVKAPMVSPEAQIEAVNAGKQYATGLMISAILVVAIIQLIVARWWQAFIFQPGMLGRELHHIRLSKLAGFLFMVSLVLSYLGNSVVFDIMPILYLLFGAAGLSLIHYGFGLMHSPSVWFWLAILYVTLIFSIPVSLVMVGFLALLDIWLDLRKRFKRI
jgi:hypothetical protein